MVKRIAIFLVFFLVIFIPKSVFAEGEFETSYDVLYDVDASGITTVTEKVTLRNLTSEYYANQFKLTIGATEISDIKASDPSGPIEVKSGQKDNTTVMDVKFNVQMAGLGKILPWTLSFKSKDFAEKSGKVWDVRAPKISSASSPKDYNLVISVPQSFGELSAVSPSPKNMSISAGKIFLTFDKDQLKSSGVSAVFGTNQLFDFDLSYHLENSGLTPVLTNITLPPDTSYQDVIFQRIDPKPLNVTVDNDGNYLAWYKLKRNEKLDVRVIGSAKLYTNSKVKDPYLPDNLKNKYTSGDKYWEKDNPQIGGKLAEILADMPADTEEQARLIYRFVVDNLKYDQGRISGNNIERFGALAALNNPDAAVCMEFTDLFIALARAAGIPARELDGYAHTANTALRPLSLTGGVSGTGGVSDARDVLHAWPEYWDDKRGWVMTDPTWENTTGGVDYFSKPDLNHFVFAIRGFSSSQPISAGSFKYIGEDSRDVKVTLSENDFLGKPQLSAEIDVVSPVLSGFPGKMKIKVTNSGNGLFSSAPLGITSSRLTVLSAQSKMSGPIPAYGTGIFEFDVRTKSLFDDYEDEITVLIGGQKFTKNIVIKPFILLRPIPLMIGAAAAAMVLLYLAVLGIHFYRARPAGQAGRLPEKK